MFPINTSMRLREFNTKGVHKTIIKHCQPFLKMIDNRIEDYIMWRGMNESKQIIRKSVRLDDRKPESTAQDKHEKLNTYFIETFGEPFRNSIHVTGSSSQAHDYGELYTIFPIGNFRFIWSPKVNDIAISIRWPQPGGWSNFPPSQEVVNEIMDQQEYSDRDLPQAIKSGNEIMIRCDEYYAVHPDALDI